VNREAIKETATLIREWTFANNFKWIQCYTRAYTTNDSCIFLWCVRIRKEKLKIKHLFPVTTHQDNMHSVNYKLQTT